MGQNLNNIAGEVLKWGKGDNKGGIYRCQLTANIL